MTVSYPRPETKCLRCGVTYRETRAKQQITGLTLTCARSDYWGEDTEWEWSKHQWAPAAYLDIDVLISHVEDALNIGQSTREIADAQGIQYESLLKRLRGTEVRQRLLDARREEWEIRRRSRY